MGVLELQTISHKRLNPLTKEWILVSPQRMQRPWQGQTETAERRCLPAYDPTCYLCPGNKRAGGTQNEHYSKTFVFDNDFSALMPDVEPNVFDQGALGLMVATTERGACRVICFSPRHDLTLSQMTVSGICHVVDVWIEQIRELGGRRAINYVQVFENRGEIMGCSNPHPHGQIWASEGIPNEPTKEQDSLREYYKAFGRCLLCDYVKLEAASGERTVCENDLFIAVVPFWATWPYEVLLLSKRHVTELGDFDEREVYDLADILKQITTRYDGLFQIAFPYSMGFHQRPTDGAEHKSWHCHAHFFPPLLRSAQIRKFMVGYELLAGPQRDITPEIAAEKLRNNAG